MRGRASSTRAANRHGLTKLPSYVFYRGGGAGGECLLPELLERKALEKAQNGNGRLLEKVGMDLGLALLPLGFGAMSVWGWRCAGLRATSLA